MERLSRQRLEQILQACRGVRVGVIGDFTLDAYWYADMTLSRLSREAPLFPRPVTREEYSLGGAANVAWNLAALGTAAVEAFTVIGEDWRGDQLVRLLQAHGIGLDGRLTAEGRMTPLFGKVWLTAYQHEQEDARLDFVNAQPLDAALESALLQRLEQRLPELQAVVVADYHPVGVLTDGLRERLSRLAESNPGVQFIADSRQQIGKFHFMTLKPNEVEAANWFFPHQEAEKASIEELCAQGMRLAAQNGRPVYITLGERGSLAISAGGAEFIPALEAPPPLDPVGAGDTYVACLAACLAAGAEPWEAGTIATLAAGVTVRILRKTGAATPEQILEVYDRYWV